MPAPFTTPVSKSIPFDNATNGFVSQDAQAAIEEAKTTAPGTQSHPSFTWGRSGNSPPNTFLQNDTVPSNLSGRLVSLNGASIVTVFVSCQSSATFSFSIMRNVLGVFTALGTFAVTSNRKATFTSSIPVSLNDELAIKIISGSPSNIVVGLTLKGSNP